MAPTVWDGRRAPNAATRSMITVRETRVHLERRKPWNRALASASIRVYEPLLKTRLTQLIDALSNRKSDAAATTTTAFKGVDLSHWISLFSYVIFIFECSLHYLTCNNHIAQIRFYGRHGVRSSRFLMRSLPLTLDFSFGGLGYELMRDGDLFGLWDLMDRGIR